MKTYNITYIDNFKIYNKVDCLGLCYDIVKNGHYINNYYFNNHIIIYYKCFGIYIKIYELIKFGNKNEIDNVYTKNQLYNDLVGYIVKIKTNKYNTTFWRKEILILHSKIYYIVNFIKDLFNKIKYKKSKTLNLDLGYN